MLTGLNLGQFELEALGIEHPLVVTDEAVAERLRAEGRAWSIEKAAVYALASD